MNKENPMNKTKSPESTNEEKEVIVDSEEAKKQAAREKAKAEYWKKAEEETGYERYSDNNDADANETSKQTLTREVAEENFEKYVDSLDPSNPENYEDGDEDESVAPAETAPDKVTPEDKQTLTREVAEENFEKYVDSLDPSNPENYEDETESVTPDKPASDKVTPEEWKKAEEETGYERYPDGGSSPDAVPKPEQPPATPPTPDQTPVKPEPVPEQPPVVPTTPEQPKPTPEIPKLPEQCPQIFKQEYKTEQKKGGIKGVWGWIKERFKGLITMGFWEIHQAEKFRTRSKAESLKLVEEAKNVDQIESLDYRSAYEEAAKMQAMAKEKGENSKDAYEKFSNAITAEKIASNTKEIERIMQESVLRLQESMEKGTLQGYKDRSGRSIINSENMEKFQERLRDQLLGLQSGTKAERGGAVPIDEKKLLEVVRGLDENYWRRYVYGGAELLIDAVLINYAAGALFAGSPAEAGVTKAAAESFVTMKKGDTLWAISKAELLKSGIPATNANIMAGAKTLATANHVGVNVWGLAGAPLDTMMPVGTKVSMGALKTMISGMSAAM